MLPQSWTAPLLLLTGARQQLRIVVPCVGTDVYEWRRTGQVSTLGALFLALGTKWPATAIYYLYRTLRIVATEKYKSAVRSGQAPGSASALLPPKCMKPTRLHAELRTHKTQLIKEYALLMKLENADETDNALFWQAARYLQACLLADIRPPWAAQKQSQTRLCQAKARWLVSLAHCSCPGQRLMQNFSSDRR